MSLSHRSLSYLLELNNQNYFLDKARSCRHKPFAENCTLISLTTISLGFFEFFKVLPLLCSSLVLKIKTHIYHFISKNSIDSILIERNQPVQTTNLVVSHCTILDIYKLKEDLLCIYVLHYLSAQILVQPSTELSRLNNCKMLE